MFKQQLNKDSHEYDHKPAESDVAQAKFINAKMKKMKIDPKLIVDSVKKATTNMDKNVSQETKDQLREKARQQPKKLYSDLPKKDRQAAKDYNIKKYGTLTPTKDGFTPNDDGRIYSKKHKVFADGEDSVLSNFPSDPKSYKKV